MWPTSSGGLRERSRSSTACQLYNGPTPSLEMYQLLALAVIAAAAPPIAAPAIFVSEKAVTFRSPPNTFICPLPRDWNGSDHGTIMFLDRPESCEGAGYPSNGRGWNGKRNARRIEVYYQYWMGQDEPTTPQCHKAGNVVLMKRWAPLCLTRDKHGIRVWARARYMADTDAWIEVALITKPSALDRDLPLFRHWITTVRSCRVEWQTDDGKHGAYGSGPDCPQDGKFF
jgi:hypothetical protein